MLFGIHTQNQLPAVGYWPTVTMVQELRPRRTQTSYAAGPGARRILTLRPMCANIAPPPPLHLSLPGSASNVLALCDDSASNMLARVEDYLEQCHNNQASWHLSLNNHASTRPREFGGPFVQHPRQAKSIPEAVRHGHVTCLASWGGR